MSLIAGDPLLSDSSAVAAARHAVQFYQSDQFLARSVGVLVRSALHGGDRVLLVAEADHWQGLAREVVAHGVDLDAYREAGRVVWVDARETLARVMTGPMPDPERFIGTIDSLVGGRLGHGAAAPLHVYGEMVNMLLREGKADAALRLERLWNMYLASQPCSLLCSCSMEFFDDRADLVDEVCGCHSHVIPAEGYSGLEDAERRQREIVSLQLRARAHEADLRQRTQLEHTLRDVLAERERALERERAARNDAEAASRAKDDFLAVVSHELRTPLNAILGWAQLLTAAGTDASKMAMGLDVIRRNAALQANLIEDLLDVGRILAGNLRMRSDPTDLSRVVRAAFEAIRPAADAKRIRLDLRIVGSIPPVMGDANRLRHATWHLLSNAVKFTLQHGTVDVWLGQDGPRVRLIVRDNGQGIPADFLPYVFERFRRGERGLARRHGGLGLGLAIVRHVVEAHGGTVWASSAGEGRGSTFGFDLPVESLSVESPIT